MNKDRRIKGLDGKYVSLKDGELLRREKDNRSYLMELKSEALLQNYYLEAGIGQVFGSKAMAHGGWEDPTCQLRGHFLGHFLSAAAMRYHETKDEELIAKANAIVSELHICQRENGGQWAASIPEKYFDWIARGKSVWAPHYTVHKTFMGLLDMYKYAGNKEALDVAVEFSKWFDEYTASKTREEMDDILDFETGGMLEIWADLLEYTGGERYKRLIERYYRGRLFNPLLEGVDVLSNMHANTTIPEAIGCMRVYEVTGEERFYKIAQAYWDMAVTKRGQFVTGGQTMGEIWTPIHSMAARLGEKNQEHCTVYNMMRLADMLFKYNGDPKYLDYIERNLYNGIMAQGYYRGGHTNGQTPEYPEEGLITYFLPLYAGGKKGWGTKFNDFFCCHGTLVQANAAFNRYLYYISDSDIYTGVYADSDLEFKAGDTTVKIRQRRDSLSGSMHDSSTSSALQGIDEKTHMYLHHPDTMWINLDVECVTDSEWTLHLRKPAWLVNEPTLMINGKEVKPEYDNDGFIVLKRTWTDKDRVSFVLPMDIYCTPLEGAEDVYAYSYGPFALAGITNDERILHSGGRNREELLVHDAEREWGSWKDTFKSAYEDHGLKFVPLNTIGYERYQVYFRIE